MSDAQDNNAAETAVSVDFLEIVDDHILARPRH